MRMRDPLLKIGRFGVGARAVIIVVLGFFLFRSAIRHDPREAHGLRESIVDLVGFFEGRWVLIIIALGLTASGSTRPSTRAAVAYDLQSGELVPGRHLRPGDTRIVNDTSDCAPVAGTQPT